MLKRASISAVVAATSFSLAIALHSQAPGAPHDEILLSPGTAIPVVTEHKHKPYPEKYAIVDSPISLSAGRVRTAEFPVKTTNYSIMIQLQKTLPLREMECMLGSSMVRPPDCSSTPPALRADWTVWEGGHIIQRGTTRRDTACIFTKEEVFACVGAFSGKVGHSYIVQVHFTEDGTPLDITNPRLIVIKHREMF